MKGMFDRKVTNSKLSEKDYQVSKTLNINAPC